ncbi:MAG: cation:dicarboxylase symporter family transporter, partial [Gemmatimonadetes bacterium]|nr:cation:dicarboxylase symporter family transporter [Gemmatimonadota bacterium]
AALPVALEEADENLELTHEVANLVLPLGASMYRGGSALFQGAAIVFLASIFEVPIPAAAVGGAILATFLVSLTVAPVPSSGVMTLVPALDTVGIPLDGLAVLLGVDRIPDMFRSATNLTGQVATAVVVDGLLEGETGQGEGVTAG